jgi:hypothetical protein
MTATVWDGARRRVHLQEVGKRDGLQAKVVMPAIRGLAVHPVPEAAGLNASGWSR